MERVFYSNFGALAVLCLVGVFYYNTQARGWGGEMGVGFWRVSSDDASGRRLLGGDGDGAGDGDGDGVGGGRRRGGIGLGEPPPDHPPMPLRTGVGGVGWMAWFYILLSSITGTALSHIKMELLTHITATSYASFGVTALFPVRVWQSFSRVG